MLTFYYSPGACSLVPHIALEEAGAAFEAVRVVIAEGDHRRASYLAVNPRGRVPALDADGTIVTENAAILTYIAHRYPAARLLPLADPLALARTYELLSFFASSVHVAFAQVWRMERFTDDASLHDAIREGGRQALPRFFDEIEALMAAGDWLVGDEPTVADPYPTVFYRWGRRLGFEMRAYAAWSGHTARAVGRPAARRALAREGLSVSEFVVEA